MSSGNGAFGSSRDTWRGTFHTSVTSLQSSRLKWNAEAKDRLERFLCDMVCNGQLDIATAQEAFAKDWIAAYQKYYAH